MARREGEDATMGPCGVVHAEGEDVAEWADKIMVLGVRFKVVEGGKMNMDPVVCRLGLSGDREVHPEMGGHRHRGMSTDAMRRGLLRVETLGIKGTGGMTAAQRRGSSDRGLVLLFRKREGDVKGVVRRGVDAEVFPALDLRGDEVLTLIS